MVGTLTRVAAPCILFSAAFFLFNVPLAPGPSGIPSADLKDKLDIPEASAHGFTLPEDKFSWEAIAPTEKLIWTDCYSDKQCARLKVPLDYAHPDAASAAIAMVRIQSVVPHNSSNYRGPIILNPGGPGGPGVDLVLSRGSQLSTIVGPEFDLIGFDPRGIGRSTPQVSFFESRSEREIWSSNANSWTKSMNESADALSRAWARAIVEGQLAGEREDGSLRFMNTDHTARDMLRIVQAHGHDKIQYWGFSYGSILGATFAAMFPGNVGRLVVDGVADSENYYANEWDDDLIDADKVWSSFIDGCVAAGPEGCPFFSPTAAEISENIEKIYLSLRDRPIPVRTNTSFGLVDYSRLRRVIFQSLYAPYARYPALAQALADLSTGNATALYKMSEQPTFECGCDDSEHRFEPVSEGGLAVICNDGQRIPQAYEDTVAHYQKMSQMSAWTDVWEPYRISCVGWPEFPKNYFRGPFVANTSFPLLFVGNTADPVTPLWAAHKMARGFNGSVVLTQDSAGHCSISGPSICTQKHIRQYFLEGILPKPGTVCPVLGSPFPGNYVQASADAQAVLSLSVEDRTLFEAVRELATSLDGRFPARV
ncbi:TAP-like protein-domain-containing protein [Mycena latifolia]|nr:TAP-like protein-domain-containing protein [Mycena latifolia]